jgi:hypothetical protein
MDPNLTLVLVAVVGILPMTAASVLTFIQTRRSELAQERRADLVAVEVAALAVRVQSRADLTAAEVAAVAARVEEARQHQATVAVKVEETRLELKTNTAHVSERLSTVASRVEEAREQQAKRAQATAAEVAHVAAALAQDRKAWGKNQERTDAKLDDIHHLVNSRLTKALETIEELKAMLEGIAPHDARVQALVGKSSA